MAIKLRGAISKQDNYLKSRYQAMQYQPRRPAQKGFIPVSFTQVSDTLVELQSVSLLTEPDVIFEDLAGMHYCDLLSPYRALEWVYIGGVIRL